MRPLISLFTSCILSCTFSYSVTTLANEAGESKTLSSSCTDLSQLNWLLGEWHSLPDGNTFESWKKLSNDTFTGRGSSRDKQGNFSQHESLRLVEMQSQLFYLAKVNRNDLPIAFRAIDCKRNKVVFENRKHDFPSRLVYLLSDNKLTVQVSGIHNKGFTLRFSKAEVDSIQQR